MWSSFLKTWTLTFVPHTPHLLFLFSFSNLHHMWKMWEISRYSSCGILGLYTCIELVRVEQQILNRPMYSKGDRQRESLLYRFLGFANYREYLNTLLKKKWNSAPQFDYVCENLENFCTIYCMFTNTFYWD